MKISVDQHIFSNVPKEQSPRKRRGYQTLFYTQDRLSQEEILTLEDRAQYYAGDTEPTKYQFHMLPDGKAVISQVVPLDEPDEFGRKGRYLSHSLIISAVDFRAIDYCPLPLFSSGNFVTSLADAFRLGDQQTGNFPPKTVNVSDSWIDYALQEARLWKTPTLEMLARLGWQADALGNERKSVGLWGERKAVFKALAVIFLLTAPEKRPSLTFDTHSLDCDWTRDWPFWAWGGLDNNDRKVDFKIEADIRQVEAELDPRRDTAFERWILQNAIPQRLEYYMAGQEDVLRLNALLEGEQVNITGIDKQFGRQFAQLNAPIIAQRVLTYFPQNLSASTKQQIKRDVMKEPWPYMEKLALDLTSEEVAEILYNLQFSNLGKPTDADEQKVIARLANDAQHLELAGIVRLRNGDISGWQDVLPHISPNAYHFMLDRAVAAHVISVSNAFYPPYAAAWSQIAAKQMQPGELKKILKQLKKYKDPFDPDHFLPLLPSLSADDQKDLAKWLQSSKEPAPRLRAKLKTVDTTSLVGKLTALWKREPGNKKDKK